MEDILQALGWTIEGVGIAFVISVVGLPPLIVGLFSRSMLAAALTAAGLTLGLGIVMSLYRGVFAVSISSAVSMAFLAAIGYCLKIVLVIFKRRYFPSARQP